MPVEINVGSIKKKIMSSATKSAVDNGADVVLLDEFGVREKTVGVCPVGCSVFAYVFFDCDMICAAPSFYLRASNID
ncbi:MAG: hypothetical protein KJ886_01285, partial [Candidatus Thermoplasmatota archaeon]|nr:hypothetical protein [Candidatus Thermoplasmatota archaeon]